MNFLSHHFFYANQNPWHNTGLILPDWSRSAPGRRKVEWMQDVPPEGINAHFISGCEKHYEADGWFHNSFYFSSLSNAIENELAQERSKSNLFANQKVWFLAHILSELLLDRLIIDKHPHAVNHLYADLNEVSFEDIQAFLLKAGKTEMGAFVQSHHGFISSRFIQYYSQHSGLVDALNRVVLRTGQEKFSELEKEYLLERMESWLQTAHKLEKPLEMGRL